MFSIDFMTAFIENKLLDTIFDLYYVPMEAGERKKVGQQIAFPCWHTGRKLEREKKL